jgi:hypothetical protein
MPVSSQVAEAAGWGWWRRHATRVSHEHLLWHIWPEGRLSPYRLFVGGANPDAGAARALRRLVAGLGHRRGATRPAEHWRACRDPGCATCRRLAQQYAAFVEDFGPLGLWAVDAVGEQPARLLGAGAYGADDASKSDAMDAVLAAAELLQEQWRLLAESQAGDRRAEERLLWGRWPQELADGIAAEARVRGYAESDVAHIRAAVLREPYQYLWDHIMFDPPPLTLGADLLSARAHSWTGISFGADIGLGLTFAPDHRLRALLDPEHPAVRGHPQDPEVRLLGATVHLWRGGLNVPIPVAAADGLNHHCAAVRTAVESEDGSPRARFTWPSLFHALEWHLLLCSQGHGARAGVCEQCGLPYWSSRPARFCSGACKQASYRARKAVALGGRTRGSGPMRRDGAG